MHLATDDIAVADHERHHTDEHGRCAEAFEPPEDLRDRSGRRHHDGSGDAERALDDDVPGRPEAGFGEAEAEHVDPGSNADEREEEGEGDERQLDDEPPGDEPERNLPDSGHGGEQGGVNAECPHLLPWCGHDGEDEQQRCDELAFRCERVELPRRRQEDLVMPTGAHASAGRARWRRSAQP